MFKVGEYVVYKKEVCKIIEIRKSHLNNDDYYIMVPLNDSSLKIDVPTANRCNYLRKTISKEEVLALIKKIPNIETIQKDEKSLESEYKLLLSTGNHEDLIKIIKTTYLRNENRLNNKKKLSDKDIHYFNQAEKYLYTEFSIALDMNYDDTKNYVINEVENLC